MCVGVLPTSHEPLIPRTSPIWGPYWGPSFPEPAPFEVLTGAPSSKNSPIWDLYWGPSFPEQPHLRSVMEPFMFPEQPHFRCLLALKNMEIIKALAKEPAGSLPVLWWKSRFFTVVRNNQNRRFSSTSNNRTGCKESIKIFFLKWTTMIHLRRDFLKEITFLKF
jgi:hypothetical protein